MTVANLNRELARSRIRALNADSVTYQAGSLDKHEARALKERITHAPSKALTPRMVAMAAYLAWRYRRQLQAHLVPGTEQRKP